ncbi:YchJ family protein [Noviherbaspirillum sp.]|uniref:YchJ family protein n=1 Tax=Noviherbaspirillum sp. TaxID=1926288 RepID=UPI002D38E5AC|nr:YchJ family metal-binding protein [Noviherbaspirillum sp.]HZW22408.1 YchJ family metal-binding protein [Noviherbaspirillum sp.]
MAKKEVQPCPCGGAAYERCCGRFIDRGEIPGTAEQLMRSRYTAYALRCASYLTATWHTSTRPAEPVTGDDGIKWLGLEVKKHVPAGDEATVEFVARYKTGGRAHRLHEVSRFVREDGKWFYVDGSFPERQQ